MVILVESKQIERQLIRDMIEFCRLCGEEKEMTFEHVPPRVTFNKHTRYVKTPFLDYYQNDISLDSKPKGKIYQGGVGYYSLCKDCNSFLGQKYVPAFNAYSNSFIQLAKRPHSTYYEAEMHDFEALKVLKQIVAMFLVINSSDFSKANRDLAEFVLNFDAQALPERFRAFMYLNSVGQLRYIPLMTKGNFKSGTFITATEITFPPLGHVLTVNFKGRLPKHHEITAFGNVNISEKVSEIFKMYRLPTHLSLLLDYRDKATIQDAI